jgi:hypothetical protein
MELPKPKINIFSPNFFPVLMFSVVFAILFAAPLIPEYWRGFAVIGTYFVLIGAMLANQIIVKLRVMSYKHIKAIIRVQNGAAEEVHLFLPPNADNLSVEHVQIKESEVTVHKVDDNGNPTNENVKIKKNNDLYFMKLHMAAPVSFAQYKDVTDILAASRKMFDETFAFKPRRKCAEWQGNELYVDHPFSDVATCYLADFAHSDFGKDVPILYIKEAGGFWNEIDNPKTNQNEGLSKELSTNNVKSKEDLHGIGLEGAIATLQAENVSLMLENEVVDGQVQGIKKIPTSAEKAGIELVEVALSAEHTFANVLKLFRGKPNYVPIILAMAVVGVLGLWAYSDPQALAETKAYVMAYWPVALLIIVGGGLFVWWVYKKTRRLR